jgi:hypothetical protein
LCDQCKAKRTNGKCRSPVKVKRNKQ